MVYRKEMGMVGNTVIYLVATLENFPTTVFYTIRKYRNMSGGQQG